MMLFEQLFGHGTMNFEKRCRVRIRAGMGAVLLGCISIAAAFAGGKAAEGMGQMCIWFGIGLVVGGFLKVARNRKILKNPELKKSREITETDERNREIGLKCWAYSGYTMFLLLYIGILAGVFYSEMIAQVLLVVTAVYALLLLIFRWLLEKSM